MSHEATVVIPGVGAIVFATQARPDEFISATLCRGEEWEPFESMLFRSFVGPGTRVCDIGANLGWYTVQAAVLGAEVFAAEPDPVTFALLEQNLHRIGAHDVDARCLAVGAADEVGALSLHATNQGDHRLNVASPLAATVPVPVRRLDDLFGPGAFDVVKIDTQGSEVAVLQGGRAALSSASVMCVECWPAGLASTGFEVDALLAELATPSRAWFELDAVGRRLWPSTPHQLRERLSSGRFSIDGGDHLDLLLLRNDLVATVAHLIAPWPAGRPLADHLHPDERRRVELTVSCGDCADVPKAPDAGAVIEQDGHRVQVMHNGVRVVEGAYYGSWTTEIVARLRGHHEPQEELVVHRILERLANEPPGPEGRSMVELGSYWAFYALWFLQEFPDAAVALLEPDPEHLEVGALNLALNGRSATVFQAAVGPTAGPTPFECDDGKVVDVPRMTLADVQHHAGIPRADLVLADIQGGETELLEHAVAHLARSVRFLVVSTHAGDGPGGVDRHDHCLAMLQGCGAHVIAEHTVEESFSGDGLIAVSFDPRDRDLVVPVSRARARDAVLFEPSKAEWRAHARNLEMSLEAAREYVASLEEARRRAEEYAASLEAERLRGSADRAR